MKTFEGKKALIIEDDVTSVKVLQHLLAQAAVEAQVISNTSKIMDELERLEAPDVVFLDLEMPFFDGYDVLQSLKNNERFEGVPVVAYTTHTSHMNDARKAGFHSFLGKPLDGRIFASQLERIFSNESVWEVP